jgi:hypothetical protein
LQKYGINLHSTFRGEIQLLTTCDRVGECKMKKLQGFGVWRAAIGRDSPGGKHSTLNPALRDRTFNLRRLSD